MEGRDGARKGREGEIMRPDRSHPSLPASLVPSPPLYLGAPEVGIRYRQQQRVRHPLFQGRRGMMLPPFFPPSLMPSSSFSSSSFSSSSHAQQRDAKPVQGGHNSSLSSSSFFIPRHRRYRRERRGRRRRRVGGREGGREGGRTGETDAGEPAGVDSGMAVHTDGDTLRGLVR